MSDCRYGADAISYAFSLAKGNTSCEADAVGALVELLEQVRFLTEHPVWGSYLGRGVCNGASRQPGLESRSNSNSKSIGTGRSYPPPSRCRPKG